MERELNVTKAREELSNIVDRVQFQGDTYVISRNGKPAVAVVPLKVYENWRRQRQEFFDLVKTISSRSNLDADQAMELALEAQRAVRDEMQKEQ